MQIDIAQPIAAGERILLIINQHDRGAAGGAETFNRWGLLLSFSEGLIVRAVNYYGTNEALQAISDT